MNEKLGREDGEGNRECAAVSGCEGGGGEGVDGKARKEGVCVEEAKESEGVREDSA